MTITVNDIVALNEGSDHLYVVKEIIFAESGTQYQLALRSGAPVGIYNEDEIRQTSIEEQSVGRRLNGV